MYNYTWLQDLICDVVMSGVGVAINGLSDRVVMLALIDSLGWSECSWVWCSIVRILVVTPIPPLSPVLGDNPDRPTHNRSHVLVSPIRG